ncbi:MAG: peptide chain release factor 2 [bacterium]
MSREKPLEPFLLRTEIRDLREKLAEFAATIPLQNLRKRREFLVERSSQQDFWQTTDQTEVLQEIARLDQRLALYQQIQQEMSEIDTWFALMEEKDFTPMLAELAGRITGWQQWIRQLETQLYLVGPYDERNAILSIHAGAGGRDAQDWAEILLRMYLRWADRNNFRAEVVDTSPGEEAGIKSATVEMKGNQAYGLLINEKGVHRLVRISPFDANHRRHTSFALVEVIPEIENETVEIGDDDLRIETFRSSGHGGQNVQKTDTAVRITHIPSGVVVQCQNQRSQLQNKVTAMKILVSRLAQIASEKDRQRLTELRGEYLTAAWGNQIRSYVLHPYTMVKDHRTGYEVGDVMRVLDGSIEDFIRQNLRREKAG